MTEEATFHAFRSVPKTGVIYVTSEATRAGFTQNDPEWCNLGQGQPDTGELEGLRGDRTIEGDETFFVNLSRPSNATIADAQGVGTIKNDD